MRAKIIFKPVLLDRSTQGWAKTNLSIAHQCGVLPHQDVGAKEEHKSVTETQQRPVQKGPERQQRVSANVSEEHKHRILQVRIERSSLCLVYLLQSDLPVQSRFTLQNVWMDQLFKQTVDQDGQRGEANIVQCQINTVVQSLGCTQKQYQTLKRLKD